MDGHSQATVPQGFVRIPRVMGFVLAHRQHAEGEGQVLFVMGEGRLQEDGDCQPITLHDLGAEVALIFKIDRDPLLRIDPASYDLGFF